MYCVTGKTETRQREITSTHFNTKCDALMYPAPFEKSLSCPQAVNPAFTKTPKTPIPPAADWGGEKAVVSVGESNPTAKHYGIINLAADAFHKTGQFLYRLDPLRFPVAEASPVRSQLNTRGPVEPKQQSVSNREHRLHLPSVTRLANKRIIQHFRKKNLLKTTPASKETLMSVVAGYLFDTEKGGIAGHAKEVKILARHVLTAAGLYGAKKHEKLSTQQAESVIRYWVFCNILGTSPEEYIARKLAGDAYPSYFTISSIHHLLSLQELHKSKSLHLHKIPNERWGDFNAMWFSFLLKEIPVLKFEEKAVKSMALGDYNFAALYTGSRFLDDFSLEAYTREEAIRIGKNVAASHQRGHN
ncbi:hypothetical protein GTU79_03555 [Sodalis ligni]|uniref:hypothetical protein n=1 Tax=Sodalis ligni TaxID=2697027 RepID=UPI001BDF6A9F|nr:hypothetical protein [Sodalis ligni]QWA11881.1 hypothetical protein GTU79_03555 [Sodalis ligni]